MIKNKQRPLGGSISATFVGLLGELKMGKRFRMEATSFEKDPVLVVREPPLGFVVLNRPEVRNALNLRTWQRIAEALEELETERQVRVIIIRGATDEAFIAGADISEFPRLRASAEQARAYEKVPAQVVAAIVGSKKPVLAMIAGFCLGGGIQIALACDMRFAARGTRLGVPAARLGLIYPPEAVRMLAQIVGPANARDLLLSGRHIDADEALAMGLVNRVLEPSELENYTREYALRLSRNAPLTMAAAKQTVAFVCGLKNAPELKQLEEAMWHSFESEDFREGVRAFLEKRRPVFSGR
jgi:enoyl-CoA hydratase